MLEEAPIAVDSFAHKEPGVLFFCSHVHEDHLRGLNKNWKRGTIYCSAVSALLLAKRWPALQVHLRPLELDRTHRLFFAGTADDGTIGSSGGAVEDKLPLDVTVVDANHVPGAVMFIFSGYFGTLLHTGDFRLHPEHAGLCTRQQLRGGLTRIYLDNTYCHPSFMQKPRQEVIKEITGAVSKKWPCLLFVSVYQLGKETLLSALARHLGTRVLVPPKRAEMLEVVGEATDTFRLQPCGPLEYPIASLWRLALEGCVWAVSRGDMRPALWRAASNGVSAFGISPTGWSTNATDDGLCDGVEQFAYSDHSSFIELVQFLSLLPVAPVSFLSPVPTLGGKFSYDGEEGVERLLELSGVPSVAYTVQGKRAERIVKAQPSGERTAVLKKSSKPVQFHGSLGSSLSESSESCVGRTVKFLELLDRPVAGPTRKSCPGLRMHSQPVAGRSATRRLDECLVRTEKTRSRSPNRTTRSSTSL